MALALCLLALALAAHAEPAVFETELIATERGDACTSDIATADWERCSAVMEACKVRRSSGGR